MKLILIHLFLVVTSLLFSQTKNDLLIRQNVEVLKKHECVLLFYNPHFDKDKANQKVETDFINELDFETLDSLLQVENKEIQLYVYFAMCLKHRNKITKKHKEIVNSKKNVVVCDGLDSKSIALGELCSYLYENTAERKEKIENAEARKIFDSANELQYKGPVDFKKMIELLNEADSIEPRNSIILQTRGEAKLNSKLDVDGAFIDFEQAILYSKDKKSLEIRYHNRGLSYLDFGDITKACEDWHRAGKSGEEYINEHCGKSFDTIIHQNKDEAINLQIQLQSDTAYITSSHNIAEMRLCYLDLTIKNEKHPELNFKEHSLSLGLEFNQSILYLEAIREDGKKFNFFKEGEYSYFGSNDYLKMKPGDEFKEEINFTNLYHFPYEGNYQIRIVMRPSESLKGLEQSYYSNWVKLRVVKDYRIEDYSGEEGY